jgi:23S rRNA (adenine2503-C2)-methyltransferase
VKPLPRGILDLARADAEALLERLGQPRYRADQLLAWVHGRGIVDPAAMTNLPRALRLALAAELPADLGSRVRTVETSQDGTTRIEVELIDGAVTETVLIPEDDEPDEPDVLDDDAPPVRKARAGSRSPKPPTPGPRPPTPAAFTQCLSTQVGCAFRCAFCRSGSRGFLRQLAAGEILAQRTWARRTLGARGEIVRTVLMGIGEPLQNLDEVLAALRTLTDPRAGAVSPRRITVSTVGLPDGIRALGAAFDGRMGLAWSLHAADEETRRVLLPVASRRPVGEIVAALRDYPLPPRRRITVECVLVGGVNDGAGHARAVVRLLAGLRCKVNLIPFNPWGQGESKVESRKSKAGDGPEQEESGTHSAQRKAHSPLVSPTPHAVDAYREVLVAAGLSAFVRKPRGADILAACGQLLGTADLSPGGRWDS